MHVSEREALIEKIGVNATDKICILESQIEEIHEYLRVVPIAQTRGFKLVKNPALFNDAAA
jgi:hypothetical protein